MANKTKITAYLSFEGDGSSTTLATNLVTAPLGFAAPNNVTLAPAFTLLGTLPTAIHNEQCTGGSVTAALGLLGSVTFTFGFTPAAATTYLIAMDLIF